MTTLYQLPRYFYQILHYVRFDRTQKFRISPYLNDLRSDSGEARGHYFWQDLITAKWIFQEDPIKHLDVGSRVDGFIAHLLCFRKVTVLDLRSQPTKINNLEYINANAQLPLNKLVPGFDSVSSLHSIEHFGLGRYGDPIDPRGHVKGLENISNCVKIKGTFYFSLPIGKPRVYFNEQRILDPLWAIRILSNFELVEFVLIPWTNEPIFGTKPEEFNIEQKGFCGLYKMRRIK